MMRSIQPASRSRHAARGARACAIALLLACGLATAAGADPGRDLLDEATRRNGTATWQDRTLDLSIESRSGDTTTRTRQATVEEMQSPEDGRRTFMEFTSPSDVEGTLYLHLRPNGGEEQEWIYAPATRRPRRLTPGQSDEVGTGAELGYREVERATMVLAWSAAEATATLLDDATLDGRACRVVRITPRERASGEAESYDVWLGADDLLAYKIVPNGAARGPKEILLSDHESVAGHQTPRTIEAVGADGTWRTVFRLSDVRYDVGLRDSAFSLARLSSGR